MPALGALPSPAHSPASLPSSITRNITEITLTPHGMTGAGCTG